MENLIWFEKFLSKINKAEGLKKFFRIFLFVTSILAIIIIIIYSVARNTPIVVKDNSSIYLIIFYILLALILISLITSLIYFLLDKKWISILFIVLLIIFSSCVLTINNKYPKLNVSNIFTITQTPNEINNNLVESTTKTNQTDIIETVSPIVDKYLIMEDCIPSNWANYLNTFVSKDQFCLDYAPLMGITPKNNGLIFDIGPNNYKKLQNYFNNPDLHVNGIYFSKPNEINSIKFTVEFTKIVPTQSISDINFFFGTIQPERIDYKNEFGKFVNFRIVTLNSSENLTAHGVITVTKNPFTSNNPIISTFSQNEPFEIIILFQNNTYSIQINGRTDEKLKNLIIPNSGYNFTFGYSVPFDGTVSISISDMLFLR